MMTAVIEKIYNKLYAFIMVLCKLLLIADILITSVAVAGRYISFIPDPAWSEEVVLTCMIYMSMLAAALAVRRQAHVRMTILDRLLPPRVVAGMDVFCDVLVTAFACLMLVKGLPFAMEIGTKSYYVSLPWLPKLVLYAPVPLAGLAIILFEIEVIYKHMRILLGKEVS